MTRKRRNLQVIFISLIFIVFVGIGIVYLYGKAVAAAHKKADLNMLSTETYQGAFFSMYDISTYPVEDFTYYFGIDIVKAEYCIRDIKDMNDYLSSIFSSGNEISNIYIGIDPFRLWQVTDSRIEMIQEALEEQFFPSVEAFPEVSFEIMLSYPSMEYWLSLSEEDREISYILYQEFAQIMDGRENIKTFYIGAEEWLIQNSRHYIDGFTTTEEISKYIFLFTHSNDNYIMNSQNAASMIQKTTALVEENVKNPPRYPDLSQWDIVFFGDSIIGNYTDSLSIPGTVNAFSNASVYNCAQGGISASEAEPGDMCFPSMVNEFVSGQVADPELNFGQGVRQYYSTEHKEKKTCFIINYGLNDYFGEHSLENLLDIYDITTYAGAIRTGVSALKEKYPDAMYIIMGPGRITTFSNGTEPRGEEQRQLVDYYNCAVTLSEELGLFYLDLYNGFPEGDDTLDSVLVDGCHYNPYGRYALGIKIINFIAACQ